MNMHVVSHSYIVKLQILIFFRGFPESFFMRKLIWFIGRNGRYRRSKVKHFWMSKLVGWISPFVCMLKWFSSSVMNEITNKISQRDELLILLIFFTVCIFFGINMIAPIQVRMIFHMHRHFEWLLKCLSLS